MGIKVGMPILKLSKKGSGAKRTGKFIAVVGEALKERWGKDPAIDNKLSVNNEIVGIDTALALEKAVDKECAEYNVKRKAKGERSLRSDAITGFALIVKPPAVWISGLSAAERKRFFDDTDEIIRDIMGGYTDDNGVYHSNIRSEVLHRDEVNDIDGKPVIGEHKHYFGMPYTKDGRICAKELINLKLFKRFNSDYPKLMQKKGWDVDEMAVYDVEEAAKDPEYKGRMRAEHDRKRKAHGLESKEYKENQRIAKAVKEAEERTEARVRKEYEDRERQKAEQQAREQQEQQQQEESQSETETKYNFDDDTSLLELDRQVNGDREQREREQEARDQRAREKAAKAGREQSESYAKKGFNWNAEDEVAKAIAFATKSYNNGDKGLGE